MTTQMKSPKLPNLFTALFLSLTLLGTSCSKQEATSNEPAKAKPFEGQIFRTADDRQAITLISTDELEMRGGDVGAANLICKYTRQDDTLRVVKTMLGTTLAIYYKITPEGLKANDGTVLLNPAKFLAAKTDSLLGSGNKKRLTGDYDGAIGDYNLAIEIDPKCAGAHNGRGLAKSMKRDSDGAIADYSRAIKLDPSSEVSHFYYSHRGDAYMKKGDYERAIQDYSRAIELDPKNDWHDYSNRGDAYMKKGDYERAIQDYSRDIELNEKAPFAYNGRGWAYCKKRDYDRAWADVKRCRELGGKVDGEFLAELTKASGRTE